MAEPDSRFQTLIGGYDLPDLEKHSGVAVDSVRSMKCGLGSAAVGGGW